LSFLKASMPNDKITTDDVANELLIDMSAKDKINYLGWKCCYRGYSISELGI